MIRVRTSEGGLSRRLLDQEEESAPSMTEARLGSGSVEGEQNPEDSHLEEARECETNECRHLAEAHSVLC